MLISLTINYFIAAEQNKVHKQNYIYYQQACKLMDERKYSDALATFMKLDENYQKAYQVQEYMGICAAALGDYEKAKKYLSQAEETRPALKMDQLFLETFGEVYYYLSEYEKARLYLTESLKYDDNAQLKEKAQKILQQLDNSWERDYEKTR